MVCGVYIYKKFFNFCIVDKNLNKLNEGKYSFIRDELNKFIQIVNKFGDIILIVESIGIYHINYISFLMENGIKVKIINPIKW